MIWFLVYDEIVYRIMERELMVNTSSCINGNLWTYGQIGRNTIKYWILLHTTHYVRIVSPDVTILSEFHCNCWHCCKSTLGNYTRSSDVIISKYSTTVMSVRYVPNINAIVISVLFHMFTRTENISFIYWAIWRRPVDQHLMHQLNIQLNRWQLTIRVYYGENCLHMYRKIRLEW